MKKISFHKFKGIDKRYIIHLDQNIRFEFTDRRKANNFMTVVSNFFTSHFQSLNHNFILLFTMFREYYFLFEKEMDYKSIKNEVDSFQNVMDISFQIQNSLNGKCFVYANTRKMYMYLNNIILMIRSYVTVRSSTNDIIRLKTIEKTLYLLLKEFENFDSSIKRNYFSELRIVA